MNTIFVKYNKTYTLSFPKNTIISIRSIMVKFFDKFFHENVNKGIIDIISENNYNFLRNCSLSFHNKFYKFDHNYHFNSNKIKDCTFFLLIHVGKRHLLNDNIRNEIRIVLNE